MSGTIKIGIIGSGNITRGHGTRLLAHPGVEITALAEPNEQSVKRFVAAVFPNGNLPVVYSDHRTMLEAEKLDAVLIASPHTLHFKQITDCLDAGLHVLQEKPMVCSTDETLQVIEKAKEVDRHIVVSYQRRFMGRHQFMKRFINGPDFGRIFYVSSFLSQGWLTSQAGTWRQDPALSGGGQLNDSGSHLVDMIMWMLEDEVQTVTALADNRGRKVDIDSSISYRTKKGTIGSLAILGSGPEQFFWEDMTITGENGYSLFLRKEQLTATLGYGKETVTFENFGADSDPDAHFIQVIRGEIENQSPPEDFLKVIRFTEAVWESSAKGGVPVEIN